MYHFSNQQLYAHNPYQQCPINIQDSKLQNFNNIPQAHYPQVLPQISLETNTLLIHESAVEEPGTQTEVIEIMNKTKSATKNSKSQTAKGDASKNAKKLAVDTSNFSIEERLVAAVWVHERKYTNSTISEIKHNFRRRFGRDPPSKTTLFAWERKLFSSGNVCDAPRTGRPVNRKKHISEVAASVRSAPALSLRARARALRLPRSTLHHILRHDLPPAAPPAPARPAGAPSTQITDKPGTRRVKLPRPRQRRAGPAPPPPPAPAPPPPPAPAHYAHLQAPASTHNHLHPHSYT